MIVGMLLAGVCLATLLTLYLQQQFHKSIHTLISAKNFNKRVFLMLDHNYASYEKFKNKFEQLEKNLVTKR
jgi:DNA-dependent RNA polymerase auxiliary subunit epsilon